SHHRRSLGRRAAMTGWRVTGVHITTVAEWSQCAADADLRGSVEFVTLDGAVVRERGDGSLPQLDAFARLGCLEILGWATSLATLDALAAASARLHLHTLRIEWARELTDVSALRGCAKLEVLSLRWCPA